MQKLLRRNPASSPLLCSSFKTAFLSFQPFKPHNTKPTKFPSFPLGSHPFATTAETQFLFPAGMTATAGFCGGSSSFAPAVAKKATVVRPAVSSSTIFAPCRSAIDTRATPLRAWVATRPAWYCTVPVPAPDAPVTAAATAAAVEGLRSSEGEGGENGEKEEKGVEEKGAKLSSRRQKGSGDVVGNADLLTIPGVGPKNLRKLVEKGFRKMAELKQFYKDKFLGKSNDTMVEYLQSSVGIIHRNHAQSITNFIKESVDEELKDLDSDVKAAIKKRLTFCVEGNISVGKTTFLQRIVSDTIELRDLVEVVPEPVDKWQDVGPDHFNILDAFYAEPHRYAYTFQNYVFVTRVMQERESSGGLKPLRLMERSVFSDRMVFVRAVHEAKWMNEMEISIYDSWFDPVVSALPGLIPDGFIYLRASPDTCHKRMKLRKREEEGGVTLDYLRDLHEKHESWLFPFQSGNHGVLSVTKLPSSLDPTLHPEIRDRVFYLEGDHMHRSIQKVPALVLDCEVNIDLNRDIEAKEHYARQVSEFFKYVKNIKEAAPPKAGEGGLLSNRQILLPHEGGLMLPHGEQLRQALSFMPGK